MLAVSNTSPISNLAHIDRLGLLKVQFPKLWIPNAVKNELERHPSSEARASIEAAYDDGWLCVGTLPETHLKSILLQQVHQGEAEAIALAVDLNAQLIILDEREGRALATQAGLTVTGTLGILLKAKELGTIEAVKPELNLLRSRTRFFLTAALEKAFLDAAGE